MNWELLYNCNFDLQGFDDLVLDLTFEFNNITYLDIVMENHPSWPLLKELITKGINYPLEDIDKAKRIDRLQAIIYQGNHLVRDSEAKIKIMEFIDNELNYGYLILILKNKVIEISGTEACPIHIVT